MKKRRKGKRGRGLPRRAPRCRLADVREDGQAVRAPTKGAAASPFDGGALTRVGSACAGEGAGYGTSRSVAAAACSRSPPLLAGCCCAEERKQSEVKRERKQLKMS